MKMYKYFFIIFFSVLSFQMSAQSAHELLREGNKSYSQSDYTASEEAYLKALEKDPGAKANFNLGNTLFQQERFEEASEAYAKALGYSSDDLVKSKAHYNLGNSLFNEQKFDESIQSFK